MLEIAKREPVRTSVAACDITGVFHPGDVTRDFCRSAWVTCVGDGCEGGSVVRGPPRVLHVITLCASHVRD